MSDENIITWENCAIGFYFNGTIRELEGDIRFEPGYYLWNAHTILDWETATPVFDFVYLMKAEGKRLKEDGTPVHPNLYKECKNGIVVRKLPKLSAGKERPPFENRDEDVFMLDIPEKLQIHGEEFHWVSK